MKLLIIIFLMCSSMAFGQVEKDTVMLDTTNVEKINRVPTDTSDHNMPVAPLYNDTSLLRNTRDDADPGRPKKD